MKAPTPAPTFSQKSTVSQVLVLFSGKGTPLMQCFGSFHTYKVSFQIEITEQQKMSCLLENRELFKVEINKLVFGKWVRHLVSKRQPKQVLDFQSDYQLGCPLDCSCRFKRGKRVSSSLLILTGYALVWTGIVNWLCLLWKCLSTGRFWTSGRIS